jgi:hypothetical protein
VLSPDLVSADVDDRALAVPELRGRELVGLEDRNNPVDTGLAL